MRTTKVQLWRNAGLFLGGWLIASACWADVWAYVDEKGIAHFATSQLDARYQLFAKVDEATSTPPPAQAGGATSANPVVAQTPAAPGTNRRLLGLFEISPDFFAVRHHLRQAAQRHGVAYELLQALIATESGFNRHAVSPKGAVGLMQLMPATASRFGVKALPAQPIEKRLLDPATNIEAGTRYLRYLIDMFPGQLDLALAAYNAGEGAVSRAGKRVPNYPETQNYVKTVSQLHRLLLGPNAPVVPDQVQASAPPPASMMVPGAIMGRSNMVQGVGSRSGQVTLVIPAEPAKEGVQK